MANPYCTPAAVRAVMDSSGLTGADDTLLAILIDYASRDVDGYLGREAGFFAVSADSTRYFRGSGCGEQWIDPCASITSVSVDEAGDRSTYTLWVSGTDYDAWPTNTTPILRLDIDAMLSTKVYWYPWPRAVKVIGRFGWSTTAPGDIASATIAQAVHRLRRAQNAYADVGAIVEMGQVRHAESYCAELRALADTPGYMAVTL